MKPVFVTGIGTDVGKTLVSVILARSLGADYWKPVQAGFDQGTDSEFVQSMLTDANCVVHPEIYKLRLAASPHAAARAEGINIDITTIIAGRPKTSRPLVIEGAGGLMVPLNNSYFIADLVQQLDAKLVLVSRNYLGSINHSMLTAEVCRARNLDVAGWIFTGDYGNYEAEIAAWSGFPLIGKVPELKSVDAAVLKEQARLLKENLLNIFQQTT